MTNKEIANSFQLLAKLMELFGENTFKIRSYQTAYNNLRKLDTPLVGMEQSDIESIKGVGKAISEKIRSLLDTGEMPTLEKYRAKIPEGIEELLSIKGFGPKKVKEVWEKLDIESPGELLYAVNENRLLDLKGFGKKTQDDLRTKLEYYLRSRDKLHFATVDAASKELENSILSVLPEAKLARTGDLRRGANILSSIDLLLTGASPDASSLEKAGLSSIQQTDNRWFGRSATQLPVNLFVVPEGQFGTEQFQRTGTPAFLEAFKESFPDVELENKSEEDEIFSAAGIPFVPAELRDMPWGLELAKDNLVPDLLVGSDIKGVVHTHTTDSDGVSSLRDMAKHAMEQGFSYIAITDHSKSAFYANGLSHERLLAQGEAIDALNAEFSPFRIFKGIESDILADGSLDYEDVILDTLDLVIASVHSNLRMDEAKATQRLLTAISNPHTRILGHMTGRLLLSRPGYPVNHKDVIDACAEYGVAIELNANPWRLDMDWTWIPYALEKGVLIAINPDAHSREGMNDIRYGVVSARKGGLSASQCLNHFSTEQFAAWCKQTG